MKQEIKDYWVIYYNYSNRNMYYCGGFVSNLDCATKYETEYLAINAMREIHTNKLLHIEKITS